MSIRKLFEELVKLVGTSFDYEGADQERNRGAGLHKLVCKKLGYCSYSDNGQFPDLRHQLLEIKLQTSPTIDLGLVLPTSNNELDVPLISGQTIRHKDVRYAVFFGKVEGNRVIINNLFLTTGESFFSYFTQFQGKVVNKKQQIPLPKEYFNQTIESSENALSTNLFS